MAHRKLNSRYQLTRSYPARARQYARRAHSARAGRTGSARSRRVLARRTRAATGKNTGARCRAFQASHGLAATGEPDERTMTSLGPRSTTRSRPTPSAPRMWQGPFVETVPDGHDGKSRSCRRSAIARSSSCSASDSTPARSSSATEPECHVRSAAKSITVPNVEAVRAAGARRPRPRTPRRRYARRPTARAWRGARRERCRARGRIKAGSFHHRQR